MTRRSARTFTLVALVALASGVRAEIPLTLSSPDVPRQSPLWVAESVAVVDGKLEGDWFPEAERSALRARITDVQRQARHASDTSEGEVSANGAAPASKQAPVCDVQQIAHAEYFQDEPTVRELIQQSQLVVLGRVVDRLTGFFVGEPSVLLEVEIVDVFAWPAEVERPPSLLLRYGQARVTIEGVTLCNEVEGSGPPPEMGDTVVVATFRVPGSPGAPAVDGRYVVSPLPQEVIIQRDGADRLRWGRRTLASEEVLGSLARETALISRGRQGDG